MALRNVPIGGDRADVPLDEHLSIIVAEDDARRRLVEELAGAGFAVVGPDDVAVPEGAPHSVEATRQRAQLVVEVTRAFLTAAERDIDEVTRRAAPVRAERDRICDRLEQLGEFHDMLIDELGEGPVLDDELDGGWVRLAVEAERLGLPDAVAELRRWIDDVVAGSGRRNPVAVELAGLISAWDERWEHTIERERLSARVRDLLGERAVELSAAAERELLDRCFDPPPSLNRLPTQVAAAAAVETEHLDDVQDRLGRIEAEAAELADEVAAHRRDLDEGHQVMAAVAERLDRARHSMAEASRLLDATLSTASGRGVVVAADVEWLDAGQLLEVLDRTAQRRQVVFLASRRDLPSERLRRV